MLLYENGRWVDIGASEYEVQLHFRLDCGRHLRYCTPAVVKEPAHLCCKFCSLATDPDNVEGWRPTMLERSMFLRLCALGIGADLRAEVRLSFWHGRIDFMHFPTEVLIQVDGPHHCKGIGHGLPSNVYAKRDMDMCIKAWHAGRIVVRVHHLGVESGEGVTLVAAVIAAVAAGFPGPMIVLSSHFNPDAQHMPREPARSRMLQFRLRHQLSPVGVTSDTSRQLYFYKTPCV